MCSLILTLLLIGCFVNPSLSLHEDQIGKFDWVHRGIGSVQLAEFDTSGSTDGGPAKRLVVGTAHNVLAVLNTKNGEILWRQVLEASPMGSIDSLTVSNGMVSIVTGNPPLLRTFDTHSAALVSETVLQVPYKPHQSYGSRLVQHRPSEGVLSVVHLTQGSVEVAAVRTSTGALLHQKTVLAPWLTPTSQCALTLPALVCVDESLGLVFSLPLSDLNEDDTNVKKTTASTTKGAEQKGKDVNTASETVSFSSVSLSSLGISLPSSSSSSSGGGDDCPLPAQEQLTVAPVHGSEHLIAIRSGSERVVVRCSPAAGMAVVKAAGALAVSVASDGGQDEEEVLYTAVQDDKSVRVSGFSLSTGLELVSRGLSWEMVASREGAAVRLVAVQQYNRRGDGELAVRALLVLEDDSVHLLAAPGVSWSREEALASVLAMETVDLPVSASSVSMHEHSTHGGGILSSLMQRVLAQWSEALLWLAEVLEGSLSSGGGAPDQAQPRLTRDEFNLHKLLVVATASGKLYGLDNWSGSVVWSSYLASVRPLPSSKMLLFLQRTVAHFPHPPQMALVAMQKRNCGGVVHTFNPLTGEALAGGLQLLPQRISQASLLQQHDHLFVKPLMVVSSELSVSVFPATSGEEVLLQHRRVLYVTTRNTTHLQGHSLRFSRPGSLVLSPVWCSQFPPGVITGVYPKRTNEKLHSPGRVMADRSVLYKYNNPNLAVVTAQGYDHINKNSLSVYLVDLVSGAIIDWLSHTRVSGPVHVMHAENWVVYTYHNDRLRRHELQSMELFEGPRQANATAFSSLAGLPQPPIVEKQAFILPQGVQASSHTTTEKSITTKFLLLALQDGAVVQVARWLVDPRRPISSGGPREEGLMPYAPELPFPATEIISYNQSLPRVTSIYSATTGLESTCIVFVSGLDLFFSRVFPSKMFDMLKDDFDYLLIVGVVLSLVVTAVVTRKLAQRKALYHLWK